MPLFLSRPSICFILIYPENSLNKPEDVDKYKRKRLKNIPHEQVFRGCTIIGIIFDSWIGKQSKQIDMRSCLSVASSPNDYDNITSGLRAQDVFSGFSFIRPIYAPPIYRGLKKEYLGGVICGISFSFWRRKRRNRRGNRSF